MFKKVQFFKYLTNNQKKVQFFKYLTNDQICGSNMRIKYAESNIGLKILAIIQMQDTQRVSLSLRFALLSSRQ